MTDDLQSLVAKAPGPTRPLQGQTILLVEDSRYASEAMRLTCLHLGGRIRRADCLQSARRHLQVYRPTAAIIDIGLPDGSGLELIADLARAVPRIGALIAMSGAPELREQALAAGADCFLDKPLTEVGVVRRAILSAQGHDPGPAQSAQPIRPDPMALRDDLMHAALMLESGGANRPLPYVAQFLRGIAASAADRPLADVALALASADRSAVDHATHLLQSRLAAGGAF